MLGDLMGLLFYKKPKKTSQLSPKPITPSIINMKAIEN